MEASPCTADNASDAPIPAPRPIQTDPVIAATAAEKKAAADAAAKKLSTAKKTLSQLTTSATAKRKIYIAAQNDLKMKTKQADIAMKHLQAAQASVSTGKRTIGKLAVNAYVMGGGFTDLDSLLSADGPQDLADRLSTLDALGENNSNALDRFKSAEVVASTAQKEADVAKKAQAEATIKVSAAKKAADEATAVQQVEVDKLIPLVENAFKHGNLIDGFLQVNILIEVDNNSLRFLIKNTVKQDQDHNTEPGIGLENIKKRLDLIYPNAHELMINQKKNQYEVFLTIRLA